MTSKPKNTKSQPASPPLRDPTPKEAEAMATAVERMSRRPARATMTVRHAPDSTVISNPHSDPKGWAAHVNDTFGTTSNAFADRSLARLDAIARDGRATPATETQINATLALLGAIAPANELEAVIGEQIVATHLLSMDFMSRAKHTDTVPKMDAYTTMATKLSRTMAAHVEALTKLRSGGKQQVIVKHVYVQGAAVIAGDGAQTFIAGPGDAGGALAKLGQPHGPDLIASSAAAPGLPMRSADPAWDAMPSASHSGPEALPDARRQESGSAEGKGERAVHVRAMDPGASRGPTPRPRRAARVGER